MRLLQSDGKMPRTFYVIDEKKKNILITRDMPFNYDIICKVRQHYY